MEKYKSLTHEKHLDHLVRVVPLLCFAYGVQSYMMLNFAKGGSTGLLIFTLGISLAISVMALVTYDYKSFVHWNNEHLVMKLPWHLKAKTIQLKEIVDIKIIGEEDEFQTISIKTSNSTHTFYFVDNAYELKASVDEINTAFKNAA